jgi:hypothetical protein
MDKGNEHKGVTEFQVMQLYSEIKADIAAMKTLVQLSMRKPSERLEEEWLNSRQVMLLLGIKKGMLQNLRDKRILPFSNLKNKIYYKSTDVEALLKSNYRKVNNKR